MFTLEEIMKRLAEIKADTNARSATITQEEIAKFSAEIDKLEKAKSDIEARNAFTKKLQNTNLSGIQTKESTHSPEADKPDADVELRSKRGAAYKLHANVEIPYQRTAITTTASDGVIVPVNYEKNVDVFPWNEVSSIADLVTYVSLPGGSQYTKAYQKSTGEGDYTLEPTIVGTGADGIYHAVDTTFGKVDIKRNKITALAFESEEMRDVPDANYGTLIEDNVTLSLKKKVAKEIVVGSGTGTEFVGVAAPIATATNLNADTYTVNPYAINENTLDSVIIDFGGEENIENKEALLINKASLKSFLGVRGTADKKPVYNISYQGNTALINGVRCVFTKNLPTFADAAVGAVWGIYGDWSKYIVLDFGGTAIATSAEKLFDQGIIEIRGRTYAGGAPAGYKAFERLTKPTA